MSVQDERGAILVIFSLVLLPLILILASVVVAVGSWYTHARHLQTKADAAAFAGGGSWGFPCAADVDAKIEENARQYVGQHTKADGTAYSTTTFNAQVGKVQGDQIHVVLNGPDWYDGETNANPLEGSDPSGSTCEAKILDVKATEEDSPLLWGWRPGGWAPFRPDLKRKARVEIQEADGVTGLLPIGVRVPKPVSAAAIFYNEVNGNVLAVRYFRETQSIFQLPAGLQGMTTLDTLGGNWASVAVGGPNTRIGVAVGLSFRRACNTTTPPLPPGMPTGAAPCFEDAGFTNINGPNGLCNQGTTTAIVDCFYATGDWPSQAVQSGLHFIRGYPTGDAGTRPPELRSAYLEDVPSSCVGTAYFNAEPANQCLARLHVDVDIGEMIEVSPPGPPPVNTRTANNVEVRYKQVEADGTVVCDFGPNCALQTAGSTGSLVSFSTQGSPSSPHLRLDARSLGNAVAIEVRLKGSSVVPNDPDCGPGKSFSDRCRWFYTGEKNFGPDTPPNATQILASPVQRSLTGYLDEVGPVRWLRLSADRSCNGAGPPPPPPDDFVGLDAASQPAGTRCFIVEMGLKGGESKDQDELAISFNEGTRSSQMGAILCDPDISSGDILRDGVVNGCKPWFGANGFDTNPLCPPKQALFTLPNPGTPFDDWPPIECVERRATGSMNQLATGLDDRILDGTGKCPADVPPTDPSFKWGRNYWHRNNNAYDLQNFANLDGSPPTGNNLNKADPRLVTLFLMPYDAFAAGTQDKVFPIVGLGSFYITGWGRMQSNGKWQNDKPDDPCTDGNVGDPFDGLPLGQGNEPPPDVRACGGNCSGMYVWGHFLKGVVLSGSGTPSGVRCEPQGSLQVCVPALVE